MLELVYELAEAIDAMSGGEALDVLIDDGIRGGGVAVRDDGGRAVLSPCAGATDAGDVRRSLSGFGERDAVSFEDAYGNAMRLDSISFADGAMTFVLR